MLEKKNTSTAENRNVKEMLVMWRKKDVIGVITVISNIDFMCSVRNTGKSVRKENKEQKD